MLKALKNLTSVLLMLAFMSAAVCFADDSSLDGEFRFDIEQDTYITSNGNLSFGNSKVLQLQNTTALKSEAFMQVDFSDFQASECSSAYLYFFNQTAVDAMISISAYSDDNWSEKTGMKNQLGRLDSTPIRYVYAGSEGWIGADVTSYINREMADKVATFQLECQSQDKEIWIASSEIEKYKPYLVITPGTPLSAGAYTVPFTKYEAEDAITNGQLNFSTDQPDIAYEASGRACIELDETGEFIEFHPTVTADRITVRYNIPYGVEGTIGVFINDAPVGSLALTSERIWLYKWSGMPGNRFCFWDEAILELENAVTPNDTIRVEKTANDLLDVYRIDFLELELAPEALQKPDETWVSVTDAPYNANGTDDVDDLIAIQSCINDAVSGTKKVWIPEGKFICTDQLTVPEGVEIRGAGMWHTVLYSSQPSTGQNRGFLLNGKNVLKDFKLTHPYNIRGRNGGIRLASNCTVDGVWVEHSMGAAMFGYHIENTVVKNCRVRYCFADGIHFARNSKHCLMENNTLRNTGDDSLALIAYDEGNNYHNTCRYNTVELVVWGRGATIAGGNFNTFEFNKFEDVALGAGILVTVEEYSGTKNLFCKNFLVQDNLLIRSGRKDVDTYGGSIFIDGELDEEFTGDIHHNTILSPLRNGISIAKNVDEEIKIYDNVIEAPSENGDYIKALDGALATIGENTYLETRTDKAYCADIVVKVDGKDLAFTGQKPYMHENKVMLPLREVFERLGAKVEWIGESQSVVVTASEKEFAFQIHQAYATVNGEQISLETPLEMMNGKTMIQADIVEDVIGSLVRWEKETQTIWITSPGNICERKSKDTKIYLPTDDTVADLNTADTAFGDRRYLSVYRLNTAREIQTYLKFDLSDLQGEVPSKAILKLYCFEKQDSLGDVTLKLLDVSDDWTEDSLKWKTKPAEGQEMYAIHVDENNKYYELDITNYVRQQFDNKNTIINFMLKADGDIADAIKFYSKEAMMYQPCIEIIP